MDLSQWTDWKGGNIHIKAGKLITRLNRKLKMENISPKEFYFLTYFILLKKRHRFHGD